MTTGPLTRWLRSAVLNRLRSLRDGCITLTDGDQSFHFGRQEAADLRATVTVHDPAFFRRIVLGGSIGAAESYMQGEWSCDDLVSLIRIMTRNLGVMLNTDRGLASVGLALHQAFHACRRNTERGSRRNIADHYDLSNDFFRLFLDETMTYSCGIFERDDTTLADASIAKYERICRKLQLGPNDHVLEIGAGWGGFAIHAAQKFGCRVTTTTISRQQYETARERIRAAGLADRVTLLLEDYRHVAGQYDKLVSIEMIEAVGHQYYDRFFETVSRRLAPNGIAAIQAITIADQHFERHKKNVDFIKRYVFPGSCIPSVTALCAAMSRGSDLRLFHLEDMTPHYARTLREWRERFLREEASVRSLGFDDRFLRMWEYYLAYCEGGFAERYLGSVQMILTKPACRRDSLLPELIDCGAIRQGAPCR